MVKGMGVDVSLTRCQSPPYSITKRPSKFDCLVTCRNIPHTPHGTPPAQDACFPAQNRAASGVRILAILGTIQHVRCCISGSPGRNLLRRKFHHLRVTCTTTNAQMQASRITTGGAILSDQTRQGSRKSPRGYVFASRPACQSLSRYREPRGPHQSAPSPRFYPAAASVRPT